MKLLASIKKLSVAGRISLGFAIVLLLHVSIAVLGHYGLVKANQDREKQDRLRAQVETFIEIDRLVGELQRNVLLFAYGGYKGPENRAKELQNQLSQKLKLVRQFDAQEDANTIDGMEKDLATHREIFDAVIVDRAKRRELVDVKLHLAGIRFNEQLNAAASDDLEGDSIQMATQEAFRSAQFYAMKYVHSPDSLYVRTTKLQLDRVKDLLDSQKESGAWDQEQLAKLNETVGEYELNFIQMVQTTRGYLHLVNVVLAGHSQELNYLAKDMRQNYLHKVEELSKTIEQDSERFGLASNLFSVLTIALGIAASWCIQRNISPPLRAITQTFDRLARGEQCPVIPGSDRQDELGRLAMAAQVFHDKAAQTQELLVEVNRMRDMERSHAHSQKLESLGQLASGIAHEINTPLQCVAANVEFLEESQDILFHVIENCSHLLDGTPDQQQSGLERLQEKLRSREFRLAKAEAPSAATDAADAVRRVVDIISAMKSFSHPDGNRSVNANINGLVEGACKLSRHQWKDCADLSLELGNDLPSIAVQPAEISQVLINLLVNASDAIQSNRDESAERGRIVIRTRSDEEGIVIEVEDNGPGIPESIQSRIFDPFFTTKDVGQGTGQGLSLAYDVIVRRHEGHVDVISSDSGTRFVLTLPVKRTPILCD